MKINFKKVNTVLLTMIMLSGYALLEPNDDRIEKFNLTNNEKQDNCYSYIIRDEVENLLSEEGIETYNKVISAIFNRESSVKLTNNEDENMLILNSLYDSPYEMYIDTISYSKKKHIANITYRYKKSKQEEITQFVITEMSKLKAELITDDMNDTDKVLAVFNYAVNNFVYAINYVGKTSGSERINLDQLLKNNVGVCHSFAYFLDEFCQEEGIESYLVTGYLGKAYHMWNMVRFSDGNFYLIDITNAIIQGRLLNNNFICFGINSDEYNMYGYKLDKEKKLKSVEMKSKSIRDLRMFKEAKYLGNHIFEMSGGYFGTQYYNTETMTLSDTLENAKTLKK